MRRLVLLLAFLGFAVAARASVIPAQPPFQPSGHYVAITATTSGVVATLPSGDPQIVIYNQGDVDAIVVLGPASPAPTPSLTGEVVRAHGYVALSTGGLPKIAAQTATGAAALQISGGSGIAASGGSGAATTIGPPVVSASTGVYANATVGTTDTTILAASTATRFLDLRNLSTTATVCISFGSAAAISSGACAAGEIALPPLWRISWGAADVIPTEAVHAIASAASTPFTVGAK